MPLPAPLIASVVSAIIETIASSPNVSTAQYDSYVTKRVLPPEAKVGLMQPPPGNGSIVIDNQSLTLSPLAQFRNEKNMVVMPMSLQQPSNVVYIYDQFGAVRRVWILSQTEAESIKEN